MQTHPGAFAGLTGAGTVLLTTYRRDGSPVGTPVSVTWDGDRGWLRTWDDTGKLARMWHHPDVLVAPCTLRGRVTGPAVAARSRILSGAEAEQAGRRLGERFPFVHGRLVPWVHRRRDLTTVHVELTAR